MRFSVQDELWMNFTCCTHFGWFVVFSFVVDGSFKCSCREGYILSPTGHSCIGKKNMCRDVILDNFLHPHRKTQRHLIFCLPYYVIYCIIILWGGQKTSIMDNVLSPANLINDLFSKTNHTLPNMANRFYINIFIIQIKTNVSKTPGFAFPDDVKIVSDWQLSIRLILAYTCWSYSGLNFNQLFQFYSSWLIQMFLLGRIYTNHWSSILCGCM